MKWLTEFIQNNKQNTGWKKWAIGGFVVLAILIATSVYVVRSHLIGRKIAKLLHERDNALQKQRTSEANMKVASTLEQAAKASTEAQNAIEEVRELDKKIADMRQEYAAAKQLISRIEDWEDVDAIVR